MPGNGFRRPVTRVGRHITLSPLERDHVPELARAGRDPEVWRYLRIGPGRDENEMAALVTSLLAGERDGTVLPFTVRLSAGDRAVGIVRYFDIDRADQSLELGTWLTSGVWRTPVNTEVKFLALRYAFEDERFHRVVLKTDHRNVRSARAIERLGAVREGTLRDHVRMPDGSFRSSIVYSILAPEWPRVRAALEEQMARPWTQRPAPWWA